MTRTTAKPLKVHYSKLCLELLGDQIHALDKLVREEISDFLESAEKWFVHSVFFGVRQDAFVCEGEEEDEWWAVFVSSSYFSETDSGTTVGPDEVPIKLPARTDLPSNSEFVEFDPKS